MSSSLAARGNAIYRTTGVDLSAALGKAIKFVAGVPAVNDSATVPAIGIVLEGNVAAKESSIGILAANLPPVRGLIGASADLKFGDTVQQLADGTWTKDLGVGNARAVAGVICDANGAVAGDLAEIAFFAPQIRA